MIVKTKEVCFVDGHRRRAGDVFEYNGKLNDKLKDRFEVVEGDAPKVPEIDIEEVRKRLGDYGVKFAPATGIKKLLVLLADAEGRKLQEGEQEGEQEE